MRVIEDNIELRVLFDNEEEFDEAIESLKRLASKYRLHSVKDSLVRFWDESGETKTLSSRIQNTTHRLAICLLDTYPDSKSTSTIAQEVILSEGATSNNLTGRRGNAGHLFHRTSDGWTLSDEGFISALSEILPEYQLEE